MKPNIFLKDKYEYKSSYLMTIKILDDKLQAVQM